MLFSNNIHQGEAKNTHKGGCTDFQPRLPGRRLSLLFSSHNNSSCGDNDQNNNSDNDIVDTKYPSDVCAKRTPWRCDHRRHSFFGSGTTTHNKPDATASEDPPKTRTAATTRRLSLFGGSSSGSQGKEERDDVQKGGGLRRNSLFGPASSQLLPFPRRLVPVDSSETTTASSISSSS